MGRLLVLFFLLPWWAYIPVSLGALWLGERAYEQALETEADKAAALELGAPAPVDLGAFDIFRDIHAADEVHVSGWIDADLNYELVKKRKGVTTDTRQMFMMFGTEDSKGAPEVRAALLLTEEERETLAGHIDEYNRGLNDEGEILMAFNGFAGTSASMGDMAADAIAEQGLVQSENFIFVEPFFDGREAALAPRGLPEKSRYIGWAIAAIVALIGVVKRVRSVRARPVHGDEAAAAVGLAQEPALSPAVSASPAFDLPDTVAADSPLGRLARRRPDNAVSDGAEQSAYVPQADTDPFSAMVDPSGEAMMARPHSAPVYDSGADVGGGTANPFPPVPEADPAPAEATGASNVGFYAKLALGMLVVGAIAYDPSIIGMALPFAAVALFWLGVYVAFQKIRHGGARLGGALTPAPKHQRRPDGAAQQVAVGVGGHQIDLTSPVHASRPRDRGVI